MAFQNITGKRLGQGAIAVTYGTFYTTPANVLTYVREFDLCNTTAGSITVYVSLVVSGEAVGTGNSIFYNTVIPAYSTLQWCGIQILSAGDTIQAKASAVGCTMTISGGEAT